MIVNRVSFGLENMPRYEILTKWRLSDVVLCVVFFLLNIPLYYAKPFERQFYVNDPTLGHPHAKHQRVDNDALFFYSIAVPVITITLFTLVVADSRHKFYLMYTSLLGLILSWLTTILVTDYLKNWIGRPRPDFLARCKPRADAPLNVYVTAKEVCTTSNISRLMDGFRSTPSGHSSESFAGLGYLYLWLCGQLLTENPRVGAWRKCVAGLPLLGAATIALSRTEDYRHHFVDVVLGSALGMLIAYWGYSRIFPSISSAVPFKPLLDDSDVTLEPAQQPDRPQDEEMTPLTVN
ncbi:LAFE_0A04082g1_1 [Lachancea fermentati]|uniref:LAFE_0A04082g1_1 n=1 Tax=Lachancea fermentati TaxID=4955 RepID=A0A1G4M6Q2_LACFM|nr:LAFE_0A04082g1_1 [Lachancea fermentati]